MLHSLLFFFLVTFVLGGFACGQPETAIGDRDRKPSTDETSTTEFNWLTQRIGRIYGYVRTSPEELQLLDGQVTQINELYEEYQNLVVEPLRNGTLDWKSMRQNEKDGFMTTQTVMLRGLNDRAMNDILLPHQANILVQQEFVDGLSIFRGDLMAFLSRNGRFAFGIQPDQMRKIKERGVIIGNRIDEARKRFEAEMAEIKQEIRSDLKSILSDEQNVQLDGILSAIENNEVKPGGIPASPPRSATNGRR